MDDRTPTLTFNSNPIHERGEMISLTDMWRAAGSPENREPFNWCRKEGAAFVEAVALSHNLPDSQVMATKRGKGGSTFAHWQIALAYAKYLSPEFHMWCNTVVRERMEASATKGVAIRGDQDGLLTDIDPGARKVLGGIVKGIVHREITEAIQAVLPSMIAHAVTEQQYGVVRGLTAGDVINMAGVSDRKGLRSIPRRVSDRLRQYHAETGTVVNRASLGCSKAYIFDPATSRRWLDEGGKATIKQWAAEARGQGVLKLIPRG